MEGVNILSEEMIRNFGGDTLYPICLLIGLSLLLPSVCLIIHYGIEGIKEEGIYISFLGAIIFILSIIGSVGNTYYEKYIKVIPIEDKYFIDANKYKVIKDEGEIIYLKDNNKYNEKGEIIE